MTSFKLSVVFTCIILFSAVTSQGATDDIIAFVQTHFSHSPENVKLINDDGLDKYFIYVTGGNPYRYETNLLKKSLNYRALQALHKHISRNSPDEGDLDISGWKTLAFWNNDAEYFLLASVNKSDVSFLVTNIKDNDLSQSMPHDMHYPFADYDTDLQFFTYTLNDDELVHLYEVLETADDKLSVWIEIREVCKILGDFDCYSTAVDTIIDLNF